jgi:hypothetical protein
VGRGLFCWSYLVIDNVVDAEDIAAAGACGWHNHAPGFVEVRVRAHIDDDSIFSSPYGASHHVGRVGRSIRANVISYGIRPTDLKVPSWEREATTLLRDDRSRCRSIDSRLGASKLGARYLCQGLIRCMINVVGFRAQ